MAVLVSYISLLIFGVLFSYVFTERKNEVLIGVQLCSLVRSLSLLRAMIGFYRLYVSKKKVVKEL
ncbi:hypothetical protein AB4K20DRAFT_1872213 [Rhizopus microsporus]